jgi:hypothetical protein
MFSKHRELPIFHFDNLEAFFDFVATVSENWGDVWYRGHRDGSTSLEPRIIRQSEFLRSEHSLARDFVRRAASFFREIEPSNYSRWLFLMQHYGIPTRLLDWTESLLVSLYFAFEVPDKIPPCIWLLNPNSLNTLSIKEPGIPHEDSEDAQLYCRAAFTLSTEQLRDMRDLPIAIIPHYFDQRLVAQRACFTVHGKIPEPIDVLLLKNAKGKIANILLKAQFSDTSLAKIRRQLNDILPKSAQIFPDVEGLVTELKNQYLR